MHVSISHKHVTSVMESAIQESEWELGQEETGLWEELFVPGIVHRLKYWRNRILRETRNEIKTNQDGVVW